jgi:hypothetical protein
MASSRYQCPVCGDSRQHETAGCESCGWNYKTHSAGDLCLEGARRVPANFSPCCDAFEGHLETCAFDLRYEWWERSRQWVVRVADEAGGGGITIGYCPHCGHKLSGNAV